MSDDEHKREENASATEVPEEALYGEATREEIADYLDQLEPSLKNQPLVSSGKKSWWYGLVDFVRMLLGFGDDVLSVIAASSINPKKIKWLWPNRIPLGKLTLFVGNPDNGKSLVALNVAAVVSTGKDWFDAKNTDPAGDIVIFACEDDPEDTTVPRLMAADANLERILFAQMQPDDKGPEREMRLDKDILAIRKYLKGNPNIRLVIIDPLSNYLGTTKMVDEQSVRRVLTPLQGLASEAGVAIIGIMHLNKKQDLASISRVGGAMAFVGVARTVWLFGADDQAPNTFHMLRVKNNLGERSGGLKYTISTEPVEIEGAGESEPVVKWIGQSDRSADKLLAPPKPQGRPREERQDASEWLKSFLQDGAKLSTEVKSQGEAEGFSYRTLERAKDEIGVDSRREGDRWYWKLP